MEFLSSLKKMVMSLEAPAKHFYQTPKQDRRPGNVEEDAPWNHVPSYFGIDFDW